MIGAGISYYETGGGAVRPPNYFLSGNAKIYDGSFDYDRGLSWNRLNTTSVVSMLFAFMPQTAFNSGVLWSQDDMVSTGRAIYVQLLSAGLVRFVISNGGSSNWIAVDTANPLALEARTNVIITYTGSRSASDVKIYFNGVLQGISIVGDNLTGTIALASSTFSIGEQNRTGFAGSKFTGRMRQLEMLNRVATAWEIASASSTGSFQGANVLNSDYLLAVDFDKTGTANLTTRASTPTYSISAFGGAAYTTYL